MIKVLAAEQGSKKRSGDEASGIAAPPPNFIRLVHNTARYAGYPHKGFSGRHLNAASRKRLEIQTSSIAKR